MGLDGHNGLKTPFTDHFEKISEGKVTITYREMFIKDPVIIMDMNLPEAQSQTINPIFQRSFGKDIKMTCIEAKTDIRGRKGCKKKI